MCVYVCVLCVCLVQTYKMHVYVYMGMAQDNREGCTVILFKGAEGRKFKEKKRGKKKSCLFSFYS